MGMGGVTTPPVWPPLPPVAAPPTPAKAAPPFDYSPLDPKWKDSLASGLKSSQFTKYDDLFKAETQRYNERFRNTTGFVELDWKTFKAVALVETASEHPQWNTKPMQIGNTGDPAYGVLKTRQQNSDLIMDAQLRKDLATKPITDPQINIRAAIAYILTLSVKVGFKISDPAVRSHTVKSGENLWSIAKSEGTTIEELNASNSSASKIHPGEHLKFHRMVRVIVGWTPLTPEFLQERYNGSGDLQYALKIHYVLQFI
jgi:LysM repeat protein